MPAGSPVEVDAVVSRGLEAPPGTVGAPVVPALARTQNLKGPQYSRRSRMILEKYSKVGLPLRIRELRAPKKNPLQGRKSLETRVKKNQLLASYNVEFCRCASRFERNALKAGFIRKKLALLVVDEVDRVAV